jgi:hypothetical protein
MLPQIHFQPRQDRRDLFLTKTRRHSRLCQIAEPYHIVATGFLSLIASDFERQAADSFPQLVFRFVAAFGPSVRIGPPIVLGSALTYQSLFFFRARVRPRPSFLGGSPINTRPLLIIAHGGVSTGCRESCWMGLDYTPTEWPATCNKDPLLSRIRALQVNF